MPQSMQAVLFDLDGTLADTAPDLAGALNRLLREHGREPIAPAIARPLTSSGARGMIQAGFGIGADHADYEPLKERFLELYGQGLCIETRLFPGMLELLERLEARKLKWGIVTNKAERFTKPLVDQLGLTQRAACVVSGDTTARAKPHPDSLLHASRLIALQPAQCLYVGDDIRDIQAAQAAGMSSLAVRFGYLGHGEPPEAWGANAVVDHPHEIENHL
jgi:N-acetyl-D-muramate 6-phosphate phosphatase